MHYWNSSIFYPTKISATFMYIDLVKILTNKTFSCYYEFHTRTQCITEWEMHIQYFEIKVCKRRKILFIKSQFIENVFNKTFFLSQLIEEFLYEIHNSRKKSYL
jgi:hypothetical protein